MIARDTRLLVPCRAFARRASSGVAVDDRARRAFQRQGLLPRTPPVVLLRSGDAPAPCRLSGVRGGLLGPPARRLAGAQALGAGGALLPASRRVLVTRAALPRLPACLAAAGVARGCPWHRGAAGVRPGFLLPSRAPTAPAALSASSPEAGGASPCVGRDGSCPRLIELPPPDPLGWPSSVRTATAR